MNKRILGLALPNIVTNITVPLLGMVDMAVVGHLSAAHIGAISIGASIFNLIYWNFGFLRMGTSGFTAQAYGACDYREAVRILIRSLAVAQAIALLLLLLQWPISRLSLAIFEGGEEVMQMAMTYFFIRIWAAPATLGNYAVKGWFIGMQDSKTPMWIAIMLNVVNIVCSLLFVLLWHWDIAGVAWGTVIAQYSGFVVGLFLIFRRNSGLFKAYVEGSVRMDAKGRPLVCAAAQRIPWHTLLADSLRWHQMRRFFKVNADIFLRTVCLSLVFTFITAASGRISDEVLAIDALLLQFFTLFSYIMDGFAYAGESLVGRYIGARDSANLRLSVRLLLLWGLILTVLFTILYALFDEQFLRLFASDEALIAASRQYLFWVLIVPVCGFAAFLFDDIFIGATASRVMRNTMFAATIAFFVVYYGGRYLFLHVSTGIESHATLPEVLHNNILWTAFMVYLLMRGLLQAFSLRRSVYALAA
ncbi:MAG: MATE family efflux transporter [Bacteroidales bacterium]|nr:MATE family efflux transporter [Bacteroidales bacterium]